MFRFQYGVTTKASRKLTWEVFSNWRRWNEFANVSGDMNWREGRPWEAGSRLEIEVREPVKTVVSHVITNCQPDRRQHAPTMEVRGTRRWDASAFSGSAHFDRDDDVLLVVPGRRRLLGPLTKGLPRS